MTYMFPKLIFLSSLLLTLMGCSDKVEIYEARMLPSGIKSATLKITDGKGQLRIEYPNKIFIADGKIEPEITPMNFSLSRDSNDDQFNKFSFIRQGAMGPWACADCLKPLIDGSVGASSVIWVKK